MKKQINYLLLLLAIAAFIAACKKTDYSFGKIITPDNIALTATIQGATAATPTGDGSGNITIKASANNALSYKIYFGTGDSVLAPTGTCTYKYTKLDTNTYTITVNAIGTGGSVSTLSKQIKILYKYQIPANIVSLLTNGSSKNWAVAKDTLGHFGVGPAATFSPDYYKAAPNEKSATACAYAGTITFTQASANSITMNDNNLGSSFIIGAATGFYGQAGGDGCYAINIGGAKTLGFSAANSGSSASNSTGVQFAVPGFGLVNFGTGGTTYEIISLSATVMVLRSIGIDGNAWYQILRAK
ncbi:hypothetical protein BDD43_4805 [Mucilaginibacter gracilis]|uniref:PKD domain-containing protein n=1 Tax=Mucilaginibacter gracilis TaxID=423350 RepID=A0A495J7I4_9SPHI|nr:hypothetical protein [Mucilaginibacter gracilis]RKR84562.1 hypothetical protein BDD43_4805 [Mucilaginibacter gracilis]